MCWSIKSGTKIYRRRRKCRTFSLLVKTSIRKFNESLEKGAEIANAQYVATTSAIDKAVAKGIIHKNAANRKKARLARMIAKA